MFESPVIDLAILLSFTYFVASLLLSAINETLVNGFLRLRQTNLKTAFENLLLGKSDAERDAWKKFVQDNLIQSPHIECLMREKGKYPAAIPAASFVSAVVGIIGSGNYTAANLPNAIRDSILPANFQAILLDLYAQSEGDIKSFEKKMETFYSDAMDRAGGWYKKKIKLWLLGLGFAMAVCLNIDTIKICKKAFTDKDALKTTADKIAKKSATYHLATDTASNTYIVKRLDSTGREVSKMMIKNPQTVDPTVTELKTIQQSAQDIEGMREDYKEATGYILGYSNWSNAVEQWFGNKTDEAGDRIQTFLLKLLGIIITSFALQLGSDYWFGLLTKTVNIRSTGVNSDNERKNRS